MVGRRCSCDAIRIRLDIRVERRIFMTRTSSIDRREFLRKSAIVGAGAAAGVSLLGSVPPAEAAVAGARWGSLCQTRSGQSSQDAVLALEHKVGRKFRTTHHRLPWTNHLVNDFTTWSVQTGHTPIISWFARSHPNKPILWGSIAAGKQDAWITTQARALKAAGWHGFFCFHKEPEDEGSAAAWKAAYGRVRTIFANVGVTNFKWIVCLINTTYSKGEAGLWMPSAPYDLVGADGSNRGHCVPGRDWKSFGEMFGGAHTYASTHAKKLYFVEWGSIEGAPGQRATWIADARATIKKWPEVIGASYLSENTDCNYLVDGSASSLAAFRAMGADSYYQL
jgi:hypothetical protein